MIRNFFNRFTQKTKPPSISSHSSLPNPEILSPDEQELLTRIRQHLWYHKIKVTNQIETGPVDSDYSELWENIENEMKCVEYSGKRVLDIGCRDGRFSFTAERLGAASVMGIDSDLSAGATQILIPWFRSKVVMRQMNLYELDPGVHGRFDIIMMFGVLYHLRYPFWGLRKVSDCVEDGGRLIIETGILVDTKQTEALDIMLCPVENSPYEQTSCTFFNTRGLITTMKSLGFDFLRHTPRQVYNTAVPNSNWVVTRMVLHFQQNSASKPQTGMLDYWNAHHNYHSEIAQTRHPIANASNATVRK